MIALKENACMRFRRPLLMDGRGDLHIIDLHSHRRARAVLKIEKLRRVRQLAEFLDVAVGVACNFTEPYVPVIKLRLIW